MGDGHTKRQNRLQNVFTQREMSNIISQKKRPLLKEEDSLKEKGPQIDEHAEQQK